MQLILYTAVIYSETPFSPICSSDNSAGYLISVESPEAYDLVELKSFMTKLFYIKSVLGLTSLFLLLFFSGCSTEDEKQFSLLSSSQTNIDFENRVTSTRDFNIINYMYFYDGGGVAAGDLNNNGLPDLFFVGNEEPNKLYFNRGDYQFEDVTESAGVAGDPGAWSTGVVMADINGSGYLDIYVSRVNYLEKTGPNQLFINNGDGTFTERAAEYGIDFEGYSTQAVFFDYNKSGRLDLFILNHSFHSEKTYGPVNALREIEDPKAGDRLFRNDGDRFTDVTQEAGIISSALGYGLGVAVSDINKNGWPDIYVGNDFHENDYLYINNGDGTFTESLYKSIGHTSGSSMGNDVADITNDGYVDIVSLDMMPEDHDSFMRSGGPDLQVIANAKADFGFGPKNARNTLQVNRGLNPDGTPVFSELAFTLGLAKTDWSWASLFADLDNSGFKDLFVSNGMVRRPNDLDYIRRVGDFRERSTEGRISEEEFESIQFMPPIEVPNYLFKNHGSLQFEDATERKGVNQPSFSSGAVYVDLNQNGMLDLVVSNVNMPSFVYKNNAVADSLSNYLKVSLKGSEFNSTGIGTKVILYKDDSIFYQEQMPVRGFQSSVPHQLHFGLGENTTADSALVIWPDGSYQAAGEINSNQLITFDHADASGDFDYSRLHRNYENSLFEKVDDESALTQFEHSENRYNDFSQEPLIPYKLSRMGPAMAVGDVSGNGLDDVFVGNALQNESALYIQNSDGGFDLSNEDLFSEDRRYEDVDAHFFDATGNGLLDLYVVSGGGQLFQTDELYLDRLYINEGNGSFEKSTDRLPNMRNNGSVVVSSDFDGDGHTDLFVGSRSLPWFYGVSPESVLLRNDGTGRFEDVTDDIAPGLREIGMITDATWADITGNGSEDLILVGEWMPITVFENRNGNLVNITEELGFGNLRGLWQSVYVDDLNGNGHPDIFAGNFGTNSRMQANEEDPLRMFVYDFDDSGYTSGLISRRVDGKDVPFEQLDELLQEFPQLTQQITSYADFASKSVQELFGEEAIEEALLLEIKELRSLILFNNGDGSFNAEPLPVMVQSFPVNAIATDKDGQGKKHILLAGNHYHVKSSIGGRQDAGYGLHLMYDPEYGFKTFTLQESGFFTEGVIRSIRPIVITGQRYYLTGKNNGSPELFRFVE